MRQAGLFLIGETDRKKLLYSMLHYKRDQDTSP